MSLFDVRSPEKALGAIGDEYQDLGWLQSRGNFSPDDLPSAELFNEIVETIIDQVPEEELRPEVEVLSNGERMVVCDIVRPRTSYLDDHDYEIVVSAAASAKNVQQAVLRAISVAQWSPTGESDGRFLYLTRYDQLGVERYYLPVSSGGGTVAEQRQLAAMEMEMSTPVVMSSSSITRLGESIMALHPEFKLPL